MYYNGISTEAIVCRVCCVLNEIPFKSPERDGESRLNEKMN